MQSLSAGCVVLYEVEHFVGAGRVLYDLLAERKEHESISHKQMPVWDEHMAFVRSKPYAHWYVVVIDGVRVGAVYLTHQREIGVSIFNLFRNKGYGRRAIETMMALHPGKFLANVAPGNQKSIDLFAKLGFNHIQNTYAHE